MKKVVIVGKWDPIHEGHIEHIREAAKLGDYLYIIVHPDHVIRKIKDGQLEIPRWARVDLLRGLMRLYRIPGEVKLSSDADGLCSKTLREIKPNIFAKGGPYNPDNLPEKEIKVCREIDCEIVYGVGGFDKKNNSSQMNVNKEVI